MQPAQLGRPRLQGLTEPSYCSQVHRECREPPHGNEGGNVWGRGLHTSYPCMGHKKPLQMLGAQFTEVFRSVPSTRSQAGNLPTAPGKCAQPRRHLGTPGNVQEVGAFCRVLQLYRMCTALLQMAYRRYVAVSGVHLPGTHLAAYNLSAGISSISAPGSKA